MDKYLNLDIDYDEKGDVLDIFVGKPYDTKNYILNFNYTLRLDPKTKNLVGLIVLNFSELFPEPRNDGDRRLMSTALFKVFQQFYANHMLKLPHAA